MLNLSAANDLLYIVAGYENLVSTKSPLIRNIALPFNLENKIHIIKCDNQNVAGNCWLKTLKLQNFYPISKSSAQAEPSCP